jgi:hypothetical protein
MEGELDPNAAIRKAIDAYRAGEDPDLSGLLDLVWRLLYPEIPRLTKSRSKERQHRILEARLVELGFPKSPDLQYVAGPVLWFAREKGVIPPVMTGSAADDSWTLDERKYEAGRAAIGEGITAYGDWMRDALRSILSEQQ